MLLGDGSGGREKMEGEEQRESLGPKQDEKWYKKKEKKVGETEGDQMDVEDTQEGRCPREVDY